MHTHTHTNVYEHIQIHIHTYMHIYTYIHVRTHTHIHMHIQIQNLHMHARKHAWNDGAAATVRGADADTGSPARLFALHDTTYIMTYMTHTLVKYLTP